MKSAAQQGKQNSVAEAPRASGEPLARAEGVVVRHADTIAVDGVDLTVRRGEIVSLIGPNGCGKTSLVRALLGLTPLESGSVWRKPGIHIGYVPQKVSIDESMPLTVARFLSVRRRRARSEILAALEAVGAAHVIDRPVQRISGGEFQRMLLARALLRDPDLLVLDEPAQGVDITGQEGLYRLIERIRDERDCAILIVSHDLHLVMASTDHVVCLNRHVCCEGRPGAVAEHPAYLELFGRQAGEALAVYTHRHDHRHDLPGPEADGGAESREGHEGHEGHEHHGDHDHGEGPR